MNRVMLGEKRYKSEHYIYTQDNMNIQGTIDIQVSIKHTKEQRYTGEHAYTGKHNTYIPKVT